MNTDDKYKDENASDSPKEPTYRLLGESGLVEDEEGNIYSASEIYGDDEETESNNLSNAELFPELSKTSTTPDWAAIYDPRYCGPSREAYIDEMTKRYNARSSTKPQPQSGTSNSVQPQSGTSNSVQPQSGTSSSKQAWSGSSNSIQHQSGTIIPPPAIVSKDSDTTTSSEQLPQEKQTSTDRDRNESDNPQPNRENKIKIHLSTGTIIFYTVGLIALIAYFIFLIYQLIQQIAQLFK